MHFELKMKRSNEGGGKKLKQQKITFAVKKSDSSADADVTNSVDTGNEANVFQMSYYSEI